MPIRSVQFGSALNRERADRLVSTLRVALSGHYITRREGFDVGAAPMNGSLWPFVQADVDDDENLAEIVADQLLQMADKLRTVAAQTI
jgi:hypothetical protein